jgi:hypothetical protein
MTQDGTVTYKIIGGDHKEYGPATLEEVRQWILDGRVSGKTLVQLVGSGEWKPLATFTEFSDDLKGQALLFGSALTQSTAAPEALLSVASPELRIVHCLARSGRLFSANFGLIAGACILFWVLSMACQFFPCIGPILYWFIHGALYGGLYLVFIRKIRGEPAAVTDVLTGFGPTFLQLSLAGFVTGLLTTIGYFVCVLPGIYLMVAWIFALPVVADRKLEFWSAMELSRRVATRVWFKLGLLLLLAFLPLILVHLYAQVKSTWMIYPALQELFRSGQPDLKRIVDIGMEAAKANMPLMLTEKVVLLFNLPLAIGAVAYAYEDLFGSGPARKD